MLQFFFKTVTTKGDTSPFPFMYEHFTLSNINMKKLTWTRRKISNLMPWEGKNKQEDMRLTTNFRFFCSLLLQRHR